MDVVQISHDQGREQQVQEREKQRYSLVFCYVRAQPVDGKTSEGHKQSLEKQKSGCAGV